MTEKYVIDTSAWIEYAGGTKIGEKLKPIIEEREIASSIMAIAELADKSERENNVFERLLRFIQGRGTIIPLSISICLKAAQIKNEQRKRREKFSLADALHFATAIQEKAIFVTTDKDFLGLNQVLVLS